MHFFLGADVLADAIQFKANGGYRISPSPKGLPGENAFLAAKLPSYGDGTLPFEKFNHRGKGGLRENRDTHMNMIRPKMPLKSFTTLFHCEVF